VNTFVSSDRVAGKISAAPEPHHRARGDQLGGTAAQATGDRGGAEHAQANQQDALAAEAIAEVAGCQHERREDEVVGIDDPLELGRRRVQLAHPCRQRDVDDRGVDVDREGRQQERAEDEWLALQTGGCL
jgi:hypothetical protein